MCALPIFDPESEAVVTRSLANIAAGRTTIVISHRLQTIRHADAIIVMEAGMVSGTGTHQQLLENNSIYRLLWTQQTASPT